MLMKTLIETEGQIEIIQQLAADFDVVFQLIRDDQCRWKVREIIRSLRHAELRVETQLTRMKLSIQEKAWLKKIWDTIQGVMEVRTHLSAESMNLLQMPHKYKRTWTYVRICPSTFLYSTIHSQPNLTTEERTLEKIRSSIEKLTSIFQIEPPEFDENLEEEMDEMVSESAVDATSGSSRTHRRFDSRYLVVPEKQQPKPDEIDALIPILQQWSTQLNVQFGRTLEDFYRRRYTDWLPFLAIVLLKGLILPPATYIEIHKERDFSTPRRHIEVDYPVRFFLRPFARRWIYRVLLSFPIVFYYLGKWLGYFNFLWTVMMIIFGTTIFNRMCVAIFPDRDEEFMI